MLIIAIGRGSKTPSRLASWLFHRIFPGVALVFHDPYEMDFTTIPLPQVLISGDIIEPQLLKARHEIKIIVNPQAEVTLDP